jgi:hypothetical protein
MLKVFLVQLCFEALNFDPSSMVYLFGWSDSLLGILHVRCMCKSPTRVFVLESKV